ncbi:hypothetical protein QRD02_10540 [Aequorivita sp. SDUM287046]|uniref:Uncharacterized protein n=1 Tax=Aequorivita aurantiaca TaxID=3053356 RepID=A0ABT8DP21_9FLAO|nr:hypothetical protein [Aequorivita aurantiaca]MDN3724822.1 hypothetical protein [Aequorivita aurantiaca]
MKFTLSILLLFSVLFISCNNDDDAPQEEQELSEPNFYALTVGNSWRYEYFRRINRTDQFESSNAFDDVSIIGTTEVNGNIYFLFETTTTGNDNTNVFVPDNGTVVTKLRDSAGYLIDENGLKYFSYSNLNQEYLIRDAPAEAKIYGVLANIDTNVQVGAGNFVCSVNEHFAKFEDGSVSLGRDFYSYSEDIGQIKSTCSFVSDSLPFAERRLVSYTIAE